MLSKVVVGGGEEGGSQVDYKMGVITVLSRGDGGGGHWWIGTI